MGILDHLFSPDASAAARPQMDEGKIVGNTNQAGSGTQYLHPKAPPSRLAPALPVRPRISVVRDPGTTISPVSPKPNLNPSPMAAMADQQQPRELVLTVGEILPHLPTEVIKPGLHDADGLVRFEIGDLSADIARGRATILLSKLAELCPELVHTPTTETPDQAIRLPLQKLVEQLTTSEATPEPVHLEPTPESLPEGAPEGPAASQNGAVPDPPLVQMHGDLLGHAAPPIWLDPIKKNRPEPKAKTSPRPRGRREAMIKASLPPVPLAKTFAKRKNNVPAATEPAAPSETDDPAIVMDPEQQPVSATISQSEELTAEISAVPDETAPVEMETLPAAHEETEHMTLQPLDDSMAFPSIGEGEESAPVDDAIPNELHAELGGDPPVEVGEETSTPFHPDAAVEEPEVTAADNSESSEPASLLNDIAPTVFEPPSEPQTTAEASQPEAPIDEPLRPLTTPNSEAAAQPPTPENDTVPMIPTPPRIRPPAPPPPVLVTPAAGLREAISPYSTGESASTSHTAHAQSTTGEYRPWSGAAAAYSHADVARPWSCSAIEQNEPQVPDKSAGSSAFSTPHNSAPSNSVSPHQEETVPSSAATSLRPPPIQFPGTAFNTPGANLPSEEPATRESDSTGTIPIATPPEAPKSDNTPLQPLEMPDADEPRSNCWSEPTQELPVKSSLPASLVAARPAASVAVSSTSMPSRSLALFNQENLQALFMTEELLDVASLARHVAALPGITACALFAADEAAQDGEFPPDFDLGVLREMGVQFVANANVFGGRLLGRDVENVTIQGGGFSVTLFARAGLCLCVVHRARGFLPGVREKLAAVADELAKGA